MVSTKNNTKGGGPREKGAQQKTQNAKSPTIPVTSEPPAGKKVRFPSCFHIEKISCNLRGKIHGHFSFCYKISLHSDAPEVNLTRGHIN